MKREEFLRWLSAPAAAPTVVYHEGYLAVDRADDRDLRHVAYEALVASGATVERRETGGGPVFEPGGPVRVALTQRRLGPGSFEYRAHRLDGAF